MLGGLKEQVSESWRWTSYNMESGLSANTVHSITESTDGTIWAATTAGICWFDGFVWTAIKDNNLPIENIKIIEPDLESGVMFCFQGSLYRCTKKEIKKEYVRIDTKEVYIVRYTNI